MRPGSWPAFPFDASVRLSLWTGVVVTAVLFGWGAWQRRWIGDDGLIVLRTVRNLFADNGPVFNAGERVEANTSTLWTYLLAAGGWLGGPVRLEYVALALNLILSVLGVVLAMLGAARLYAPSLLGRRGVLLPTGVLVYIAIPPARDFATSGLEGGLVLAYLGLLWWMMVCWGQAPAQHTNGPVRSLANEFRPALARRGSPPAGRQPEFPASHAVGGQFSAALACVAGCSVLVRPELALLGGLALIMMLIAARDWRRRLLIVVAGGLLPVAYQIFRMGYYGLLVPGTALAKDASGDKWSQGMVYLANFNRPYLLWVPAVWLIPLALSVLVVLRTRGRPRGWPPGQPWWVKRAAPGGHGRWARVVQNPAAVVIFFTLSGLLQALYWIRQGGDFMHGRVLLVPIFCLLAPVAVIPVLVPDAAKYGRETGYLLAGAAGVLWLAVAGWSLWAANSPGLGANATRLTYSGIVDERRFYLQATGHAHPLTAADYLDYPRMRAMLKIINETPAGALLLASGNYDQWVVVPAIPPPPATDDAVDPKPPKPPKPIDNGPHTVFFTNLGMVSMNVGLDVRVIDQIGLAYPLAQHTRRLNDARIGHDKDLFPDWVVADGPYLKRYPYLPPFLDERWVAEAVAALKCPATEAVLASVRAPMSPHRFLSNVLHAYQFTTYRIDRVPRYELIRCGLAEPELGPAP